jgi:hypothetical protein
VVIIGRGLFPHRWPYRDYRPPRRAHRAKVISGVDRRSAPLLITLRNLVAEFGVLFD